VGLFITHLCGIGTGIIHGITVAIGIIEITDTGITMIRGIIITGMITILTQQMFINTETHIQGCVITQANVPVLQVPETAEEKERVQVLILRVKEIEAEPLMLI
jgi:hypothetical protein